MKEKFVLQKKGTSEWNTIGVFDNEELIHNWLKKNWNIEFEEYFEGFTYEDWYNDEDLRVIKLENKLEDYDKF